MKRWLSASEIQRRGDCMQGGPTEDSQTCYKQQWDFTSWLSWAQLWWTLRCTYLCELWFSPDECPGVGLQGQTVALFLAFLKKPAWWSPQWLYRFTFSPRVGGFPFLHTFSSIYFYRLFNDGHSDWCEVMPHCGLRLHFSKQTEWPLTEEWIRHVFFICLSLSIFIHLLYLSL